MAETFPINGEVSFIDPIHHRHHGRHVMAPAVGGEHATAPQRQAGPDHFDREAGMKQGLGRLRRGRPSRLRYPLGAASAGGHTTPACKSLRRSGKEGVKRLKNA